MLLPTNTDMLDGFKTVALKDGSEKTDWAELLDPHGPHKLMYSLQIVESRSRPPKHRKRSAVSWFYKRFAQKMYKVLGKKSLQNKSVLEYVVA